MGAKLNLKPGPAVWHRPEPYVLKGKWAHRTVPCSVRIMVLSEGYVMARAKGCAPFVASAKEFTQS